jgi:hypothetical protein
MKSCQFAISWLYEELHACRLHNGKVEAEWHAPFAVVDLMDFNVALIQAAESVGMTKGGDLALVFDSDEQAHVFVDVPPMPERDLERLLERRVLQEKAFDGEATWCYSPVGSSAHGGGALVHMLPMRMRDAMLRICQENHVAPMRMHPVTTVVSSVTKKRDFPPDEIVLVAALFESRVELIVADGRGAGLFERKLNFAWDIDEGERLTTDLERTLLYVKQRQQAATRILILGRDAELVAGTLRDKFQIAVEFVPESSEPIYWAHAVGLLGGVHKSNFVPRSVQRAELDRRILRATSWLTVATVLCTLMVTLGVEFLLYQQHQRDPNWHSRLDALTRDRDQLLVARENIAGMRVELAQLTPDNRATPAQFLAELGNLLPETALLSKAEFRQEGAHWRFDLAGATRPTMADAVATLESITTNLAAPPWSATVDDSWRGLWLDKLRNGGAADPGLVGFTLNGDID